MENFNYVVPTAIYFGKGQAAQTGAAVAGYGKNILALYGSDRVKTSGLLGRVEKSLTDSGVKYTELGGVQPNPRIALVREAVELCKSQGIDFILAVGGGSVLDSAKAIAAGAQYAGDTWDFFARKARPQSALPLGAVLTLAATGSEMNGGCVISNPDAEQKLAMVESFLFPKFSILDPELTFTVNAYQTAAGAVDIMSHVYEQYFSPTKDTFVQDRLSEAILKTIIEFAPVAIRKPDDYNARANILWAGSIALNGLLSTGKAGDWATHGIEHEVSAIYDVTHGAGLAALTPAWMNHVLNDSTVERFYTHAVNVWGVNPSGDKMSVAREGIRKTAEFFKSLGMPSTLKELGVEKEKFAEMAKRNIAYGYPGAFKVLNEADIVSILEAAY